MSRQKVLSIDELYAELLYVKEQLETDDRMHPLSWARVQKLQEYKKKLIEEIQRRDKLHFI
jgi:hypothetical protein